MCQWCEFTPDELWLARHWPRESDAWPQPCRAMLDATIKAAGFTHVFGLPYPWVQPMR